MNFNELLENDQRMFKREVLIDVGIKSLIDKIVKQLGTSFDRFFIPRIVKVINDMWNNPDDYPLLMSKKDFDKLEFSEGTEKKDNSKSDDSQEVPDEQSPNEETPDEQDPEQQNPFGGNGYDEDDMYNFFKDFFGNR